MPLFCSALQSNLSRAAEELLVLHPNAKLFVTGHSMGGALATLCALDLKFRHNFTDVREWWQKCRAAEMLSCDLSPVRSAHGHSARLAWAILYSSRCAVLPFSHLQPRGFNQA